MPPRAGLDAAPDDAHASPHDSGVYDRRWWILGVLVLSLVIVMTANTTLNVAIPSLVADTRASSTQLQWIVDVYALVFAGLVLTAGAVGDRFGRKGALLAGLVVFGSMSSLATLADDPAQLIAIRAVMGGGAALIMPGTLSILAAVFPPEERPKAIGVWAGFAGSGAAIGIIGSGWLLEHFWWGSVFLVNMPVVVLAVVLVSLLVPTSRDPRVLPLDVVGALLSIVTLGSLLFGIIEGPERGWTDPLTLLGFAGATVGVLGFMAWERRTPYPMLDLRLFSTPGFSIGTATIALTFFAMFGMFFLMTQYLQSVRGYSPLEAGLRILPVMATMVPAAPMSAKLAERYSSRTIISSGLISISAALLILANVSPGTNYGVLVVAFMMLGGGIGFVAAPATGAVMMSLPVAKAGVGSAVNDASREVGGALGIAVMGSVAASAYRADLGDAVAGLPPGAVDHVERSLGDALRVAAGVGGDAGLALTDAARVAFTDAMNTALLVAAVVALATVALVRRHLPDTRRAPHAATHVNTVDMSLG